MSVHDRSALITWTTGVPNGAPVLVLHERYADHDSNDTLGAALATTHRVVSVRSARTQMEKGYIKGYYWFLGTPQRPELSTLGDALSHLEKLLLTSHDETGRPALLVGQGEGGSIALLIALIWPELVAGVASIGGALPLGIDELPVKTRKIPAMPVLLAGDLAPSSMALAARGARVETVPSTDIAARVARWAAEVATIRS